MDHTSAAAPPERIGLLRVVGRWDLTAQGVNIVLASSVFALPGITLAALGGWSPLAVLGAGLGTLFILLTFSEAAARYTEAGGPYRYAADAFGEYVGAQVALLYWVVRAAATASVANVFVMYAAEFWPAAMHGAPRWALLSLAIVGSGWLNVRGTRQASSVLNFLTVAKIVPLVIVCVAAFPLVSAAPFTATPVPAPAEWARAILLWIFAFGGFEAIVIPASEARNPARDTPRALILALAIVAVVYLTVQTVVAGVLPATGQASPRPVGEVAALVFGPVGAVLIAVAAMIATNGHIAGSTLASPRLTYAIAAHGGLPSVLARVHPRFRTPWVSIVLFTALVWVLAVSGSFIWSASLSAVGRLLVFVTTALAVLRLRRNGPSPFAPPAWVHSVTMAFCVWLFLHITPGEGFFVGLVLATTSITWLAYRGWRRA